MIISARVFIFLLLTDLILSSCPNHCNGKGVCDKYSRCECASGFQGADCSEKICPFGLAWSDEATATDVAHNRAECSNRGICDRSNGKCKCMSGFTGQACERLTCANDCSHRGICYTMKDFASQTRNEESESFEYTDVWDSLKIKGCYCDFPNHGYDCSKRLCPEGDDPLTVGQVNEVQLLKCTATTGSFVLYYNGQPSTSISHSGNAETLKQALLRIPGLTGLKVSFSLTHGKICQLQTNVIQIEFINQFGALRPLVPYPDPTFVGSGGIVEVIADGVTTVEDYTGKKFRSIKGTKESELCSNRGICRLNEGTCDCFNTNGDSYDSSNGYGLVGSRGDCGYVSSSTLPSGVSTCPGAIPCSGHGVCDTNSFRCHCSAGWTGGDCSEMECPLGLSWFDYPSADNKAHDKYVTCANMGHCDTSQGKCICRDGFYGEACEYMQCGGTEGLTTCSGHGRCMSMEELALWANENGDATEYMYGSEGPNNPLTWDYARIHGCFCDEGFSGYDCSLVDCPAGDDPGTYEDHTEVQLLQCIADSGNFTLSFRQQETPPLSFNITAGDLKTALSALPSIKNVYVYFIYDGLPPNGTLNFVKPKVPTDSFVPPWGGFIGPNGTLQAFQYNPVATSNDAVNSNFCRTDGSQVAIIHFEFTHGDLPAIKVNNYNLFDYVNHNGEPYSGVVNVFQDGAEVLGLQSVRGTTEVAVCNNRGLCDVKTGICDCFEDWTSSDGSRQGPAGDVGDCGFRINKNH